MKPSEFYELDHEDYPIVQKAFTNRSNMMQGIARRQTYLTCDVIAKAFTGKGISVQSFNQNWPIGEEIMQDISEAINRKREVAQKRAMELSNDLKLAEKFKQLRSGGSKGSSRGRFKRRNK